MTWSLKWILDMDACLVFHKNNKYYNCISCFDSCTKYPKVFYT